MGGFNRNCKKCKKFMIYDKYSFLDNDDDYYCIKCWWYKNILPMLKNLSVTKKDIKDLKAYYFYIYDRDRRFN